MTELDLIVCAVKNIQTHAELVCGRFATLTDSLSVAALICDKKGKISVVNRQGLGMMHASEGDSPNLKLSDILVYMGLNLVDRMRVQPRTLDRRPIDGFLIDIGGARHRISMLVHPIDVTDSGAEHAVIILAPEHKRAALYQALTRSGSAHDYLSNFLLLAQESERKRIASDLHDGLGQVLTMLKFRVEDALIRLEADKVDESKDILKEVVGQLRGAVGEVRRISTELRPRMLDDLGLLPTLQWLCRQFEAAHTGISVTLEEKIAEEKIPIPMKTPMFRMIQEAMNNVAKHARATNVFIYLKDYHDGVVVGVVDNGIGFDAERLTSGTACLLGVGINSMRERVEASRGVFRIRSHAGSGTAISAAWGSCHDDFQLTGVDFPESGAQFQKNTLALDLNLTQ